RSLQPVAPVLDVDGVDATRVREDGAEQLGGACPALVADESSVAAFLHRLLDCLEPVRAVPVERRGDGLGPLLASCEEGGEGASEPPAARDSRRADLVADGD